jgi:uncharacterized membrane protein
MIEQSTAIGAVLLLTAVTVATRFSGVWIMSFVEITPRIEAFLKYLAVSVLISIVVPATLNASPRIWLAVAAAAVTMVVTSSAVGAMLAGAAVAAAARGFTML